jgi:hypothetical protein
MDWASVDITGMSSEMLEKVRVLTVAPMRGIYLQLKTELQCTRIFFLH